MTSLLRFPLLPIAVLLGLCCSAFGQSGIPSGHVPLLEVEPSLDGFLESDWDSALVLDGFVEVDPNQGAAANPATDVRLMRNKTHLFVAFTCWEPEPEKLVLQNTERDAFLDAEDRIEFVFDTFRDGKTAYFFQMSAAGSRGDGLIAENGSKFNKKWNGVWKGETAIHQDRWVAEMAIPFRFLTFASDGTWGANFQRYRGESRSQYRWASPQREYYLFQVLKAGRLTGFDGIESGWGVEIRPYFKVRASHERVGSVDHLLGDLGGELSMSLTPELKASVTWNTDFAETEVDDRKVNLSRYSTFFPEKRDFFLQDSNLFEFGPRGYALKPFFSRRIGLVDGEEVPIESGLRVAGRVGDLDLGFLAVHTEESAQLGVKAADLGVFRPAWNVADGVSVGGLFTYGHPESGSNNSTYGLDFRGAKPDVYGGMLAWNTYFIESHDSALDARGLAGGGKISLRNDDWEGVLKVLSTADDYEPGLGYVKRPGETLYFFRMLRRFYPHGKWLRDANSSMRFHWWVDDVGQVSQSLAWDFFEGEFQNGMVVDLSVDIDKDRVDDAFDPSDGITIQPGRYDWVTWGAELETSPKDPFSFAIGMHHGDWYSGTLTETEFGFVWRPTVSTYIAADYSVNHGSMPNGAFNEQLASLSFDWSFSKGGIWQNLVQWDSDSNEYGLQSRLRWFVEDGRELFLVANTGWVKDRHLQPIDTDLTVKLVYAFRF